MVLSFRYRLLPTKAKPRALEQILESQRQLYNAALEERIDAYRKARRNITYIDQTKSLTEWRNDDAEAFGLPVSLQRATLTGIESCRKPPSRLASSSEMRAAGMSGLQWKPLSSRLGKRGARLV